MDKQLFICSIRVDKILLNNEETTEYLNENENDISNCSAIYILSKLLTEAVLACLNRLLPMAADNKRLRAEKIKLYELCKDRINTRNVSAFYHLSAIINLKFLSKAALSLMQRRLTAVVDDGDFLELSHSNVSKVLASFHGSASQLQVFHAAERWIVHRGEERRKFAKSVLLKALRSLSDEGLARLLRESSLFFKTGRGAPVFKEAMRELLGKKLNTEHAFFYNCEPNVLVCRGRKDGKRKNEVSSVEGSNSREAALPPMNEARSFFRAVCVGDQVFAIGGNEGNFYKGGSKKGTVEKYSPAANSWKTVANTHDHRALFCACALRDNVFVFGGYYRAPPHPSTHTGSCLRFGAKRHKWKEVASMSRQRSAAACAAFNGGIVVAGGDNGSMKSMRKVESYDAVADKWSPMPQMVTGKRGPGLVVVRNKLFVVGMESFEVFDDVCRKFVVHKSQPMSCTPVVDAVAFGNTVRVFRRGLPDNVACYDVEKDEWSVETCQVATNLVAYSCVAVPWIIQSLKTN